MNADPRAALDEARRLLGPEHVFDTPARLDPLLRNCAGLTRQVPALLRPGSVDEVQELVRLAGRHGLPLYPISRGRNWGMGSRLPVRDGTAILDLGRLNRIREVNEEFHYAVIEPGVTQGQLDRHLRERKLPMILNVIGSGLETSLLGNALDRGVGYFAARTATLSGLEVVLGTGELLRTGFAHYPKSPLAHLNKFGVGPSLDGLFAQSNLGIVTAAGLDLIPWRDQHESVIVRIAREDQLPAVVDVLAELRRRDLLRMIVHIGNRARTIGTLAPLVYAELPEAQRADPAQGRRAAEDLLAAAGFGPWSAVAGYSGTPAHLAATRRAIRTALRGLATCVFLSDRKLAFAQRLLGALSGVLPAARRQATLLKAMAPLHGFSSGVPSDAALPSVWWTAGELPPAQPSLDPDTSPCGLLYSLPIVPLNGRSAGQASEIAHAISRARGLEPLMTLNMLDDRSFEGVITLPFRTDDPQAVANAQAALAELQQAFIARGWLPYRVAIHEMGLVVDPQDPYWKTIRDLKQVFDPHHILAPGRYNLA